MAQRNNLLAFRINPDLIERLGELAVEDKRPLPEYLREMVRQHVKRAEKRAEQKT